VKQPDLFANLGGPGQRALTAHQFALDTLRQAILSGELPPNTRLVQANIAQNLGISTTPVREALRDLVKESLVVSDPHRGAVVRGLDIEEVREVYQMREALEPLLVPRVVGKLSETILDRCDDLVREMDRVRDPVRFVELNAQFHGLFHRQIAGTRLGDVLSGLIDAAELYVHRSLQQQPDRMREANEEHRLILAAFRDEDVAAAKKLTRRHLRSTLSLIESAEEQPV
jgi:DNA-binding GntR family transcriptional regulator